jgi:hypothetical protein
MGPMKAQVARPCTKVPTLFDKVHDELSAIQQITNVIGPLADHETRARVDRRRGADGGCIAANAGVRSPARLDGSAAPQLDRIFPAARDGLGKYLMRCRTRTTSS